uniref:BAH domain-containing protein n=1 Tax=Psilocybe cubensis TaxID=181762 RepID=A0A8H7XQB5_PSICU
MVRGRPTRGGSARKSKNQKTETVTDEKFASLKPFGSFVVSDPETNEGHKFKKEDNVAILPHGRDPGNHIEDEEYWIAKIKDIRAELHEDGSNTVWARVQWFYSADDVASVIKSFDKSTIGKYEKIFSDHYDYVGPESFNAIIPMAKFYENDPEPPYIPWDKFYRRYTFEYKARMLKPKPGSSSCMCKQPYNPNDTSRTSLMHFCPRPSCRRAYHHRCLLASKSKESATTFVSGNSSQATVSDIPKKRKRGERGSLLSDSTKSTPDYSEGNLTPSNPIFSRSFRLLSCSPDTDETINLQSLIPLTVQSPTELNEAEEIVISRPAMKKRKGRRSVIKNHVPSAPPRRPKQTIVEALGSVPFELLHIAEQPLVRGAAFANGGISGNIAFVTRARRLLYKLLQGEPMPERWEDEIFVQGEGADLTNAIVKIGASQRPFPPFVCPNCKSAI